MPIVLMTDFGESSFVGQMKGVISKICLNSNIIDLTHSIEKFNIIEAGFTLYNSIQYFPNNSIFVCVVDPGVGSNRKPIIIQTENYLFIGPDNGLFTLILDKLNILNVYEINNLKLLCDNASSTFQGRDIFAPAAAYLEIGKNLNDLGTNVEAVKLIRNDIFYPKFKNNCILGSVLFADSFGNLVTNINFSLLQDTNYSIEFLSYRIDKISKTFSDVEIGNLLAYIGSSLYLEIAINQGNLKDLIYKKMSIELEEIQVKVLIVDN